MLRAVDQIAMRCIHIPGGYASQLTQLGSHETIAHAGIKKAQGFPFSSLHTTHCGGSRPGYVAHMRWVDRAVQLFPDLRGVCQQLLKARLLLGRQRCQEGILPVIAILRQKLDQPGVAPELPADLVEVMLAVEQVEHPHQFGLAAEELERGIGAVIGRAKHDQPPAALAELVPCRFVIRHQRPRQQPAAGMRQQVDFAVAAQRFLHGGRQILDFAAQRFAPIVRKRQHLETGGERIDQIGKVFLDDAVRLDGCTPACRQPCRAPGGRACPRPGFPDRSRCAGFPL